MLQNNCSYNFEEFELTMQQLVFTNCRIQYVMQHIKIGGFAGEVNLEFLICCVRAFSQL